MICLMAFCFIIPMAQAEDGCQQNRLSPEEFRAKQQVYIKDKAGLTQEEADLFFPVYFELQDKKEAINAEFWKSLRRGHKEELTDEQYDALMRELNKSRVSSARLEETYYEKFKKILSAKKIFRVQEAAMSFRRDLLKDMRHKGRR